jgi:Leucine-rich repeat (LRR) protein
VLYHNELTGELPHEIGNLASLERLYLDDNKLTGLIPSELWNLTKLEILWLSLNNFSEQKIAKEIKNLTNVYSLSLAQIQLIGTIPDEIWGLTKLQDLALYGNQLTGEISSSVENLKYLTQLHLNSNRLSGHIPQEIGQLAYLVRLSLGDNQLSGSAPIEIGNLKNLSSLHLESNLLTGAFPTEIGNATALTELDIATNQFTGELPASIAGLQNLSYLAINNNSFSEIPTLLNIDSLFISTYNYLTFEDFERNLPLQRKEGLTYTYSPQHEFGREYDTIAFRKYPFTLSIPCGGVYNHYTWYKDGELLPFAPDASTLTIPRVDYSDAGDYAIVVVNDSVPILELTSLPVTVRVEKGPPLALDPINIVVIDGSHNTYFMIENIDDYPDNTLTVFTKWGKVVYLKNAYNNELDLSNYPAGTYYYVLNYPSGNTMKQLKNFIEVIKK